MMSTTRKQFTGQLCVYRSNPIAGTLSARVTLDDGTQLTYYTCPKCFDDLITNPIENKQRITFTANVIEGTNPRSASII